MYNPFGSALKALRRNEEAGGRWTLYAVLLLATIWVFAPLRHAEFLNFDDNLYVTTNEFTPRGVTWDGVKWAATTMEINWHPLTWLSHMLDCQLFDLRAGAHHMSSVFLHLANSALLLVVLIRLTGALGPSFWVTALFAVHPLHVEPVAWISSRKDLLSTFFWFTALLAYKRYTEQRTLWKYLTVCLTMLCGLLSKSMLVTLPFTLLLLDYWPLGRWSGNRDKEHSGPYPLPAPTLLSEKLPLLAMAGAAALLQVVAQDHAGALRSLDEVPLALRVSTAVVSYATYLAKMVWPSGLAIPYPLHPDAPVAGRVVVSLLLLGAVSIFVAICGRRHRYLVFGWLWYLVTLLPVVGLVSIGHQAMADRYTYVPLIGPFIAIVWFVTHLTRDRPTLRLVAAATGGSALVAFAYVARVQVGYWHDSITLFRHTLSVTTDNVAAEDNLGTALKAAGQREEAREHFLASLRIHPANAGALNNLGGMLLEDGQAREASEYLRAAVVVKPGLVPARVNFGTALLLLGDPEGASEQFAAAVAREPGKVKAHLGLAHALEQEGQLGEARDAYARVVALDPKLAVAHERLANLLVATGRPDEAIAHYEEALRLDPELLDAKTGLATALKAAGRDG
jgi:protein O-mannosyl-transferase